jgi:uncharacterized protein (TIGR03435 family)
MKPIMLVLMFAIVTMPAASQTPAQGLKFDVATIKPSPTAASQMAIGLDPSLRFAATGASLVRLVSFAYSLRPNQVTGGPKWVNEELYDIVAKVENQRDLGDAGTLFRSTYRVMVQSLLADRFNLKMHKETQDLPVYSLVIDKRGVKAQPVQPTSEQGRLLINLNHIEGHMTLDTFVQILTGQLGRLVVNKTDLVGLYDVKLDFMPEQIQPVGADGERSTNQSLGSNAPSIFTAIQERLGLKLESTKAPVEVLVIDSAQRPSEN